MAPQMLWSMRLTAIAMPSGPSSTMSSYSCWSRITYCAHAVMPKNWARIGNSAVLFKKYMMKMLEEETAALNEGKPGAGGIMTSFVRALGRAQSPRVAAADGKEDKDARKGLSVDEIFGNIFVINFAGHDTTANTLAFSVLLLSARTRSAGLDV